MEENKWYGSRITFFINKEWKIVFQDLDDKRSCRDMMIQDWGYDDAGVDEAYRGQIIEGEIAFFRGANYECVPRDLVSTYLLYCVEQHERAFGATTNKIKICNGKIPAENFNNWEYRQLMGTWVSPYPVESINE